MSKRVQAILWKKLNQSDISIITGKMRSSVQRGGGQPDLRLSRNKIPNTALFQFVSNTPNANINSSIPLDMTIHQIATSEVNTDIQLTDYRQSRPNDISIRRQHPGYTNPRWTDIASRGNAEDYLYILRLVDSTFTSGWATASEVTLFPSFLRSIMNQSDQGIQFFDRPPGEVGQILIALKNYHNVLLYGPPGTGKTYLMQQVNKWFKEPFPMPSYDGDTNSFSVDSNNDDVIAPGRTNRISQWVTFHQSYSYESFIGGLRPKPSGRTLLNLEPEDGILLVLARQTLRTEQDTVSLLIIDEINRGNVSRIFGEFITLMEPDKRLKADNTEDPFRTITLRLPHTGEDFAMPYHVYTLATMNSVDRSVMPLDAAIRRRFHIIDLRPDYEALWTRLFGLPLPVFMELRKEPSELSTVEDYAKLTARLLYQINLFLRALIGPDFEAGHAFFWSMREAIESGNAAQISSSLCEVWNNRLLPHLQEMFRLQPALLGTVLRVGDEAPASYPYRKQELPPGITSLGNKADIDTPPLTPDNVNETLMFIARCDR